MQYYGLKSMVAAKKGPIPLMETSDSFFVKNERVAPFIEPSFRKIEFPMEKPSILLVSAVGASGKTTMAYALSHDTGLPILDLAAHKAVGDNTLTGILTTAYPIEEIGRVLEGLRTGSHGIIIDGIDEGRSKTTEEGFEAFLDDLIKRSKGSETTTIVILGRGQVLLNAWCYLVDEGADVGLVEIAPFELKQAKTYIDAHVPNRNTAQQRNYEQARDVVLEQLGAAFTPGSHGGKDAFLSFIGYPPVLDAIGTLLREEPNYYRIQQGLGGVTDGAIEIELLIRICNYLLQREHDQKALPNFVESIIRDADESTEHHLRQLLYRDDEQCARVLSTALKRPFPRVLIADGSLNERYETAVAAWCPDHPFLNDNRLRNAVFASIAIARCALSDVKEYQDLALEYAVSHRLTYHLMYIMEHLAKGRRIDMRFFNMLMQSCSDFLGTTSAISIEIDGESWEDVELDEEISAELEMTVEFPQRSQERSFNFFGNSHGGTVLSFGPYLVNADISLPCHIELLGRPTFEAVGECSISARNVRIDTVDLIVRSSAPRKAADEQTETGLFIDAEIVRGHASAVSLGSNALEIECCESELDYPLAKYARKLVEPIFDADLREKYLRLRRILMHFRSHKKGGLAKYRSKIEHERVLRNQIGRSVLESLVDEGVLLRDVKFYYIDSNQLSSKLGVTWQELRQHKSSTELKDFLRKVK